MTINSKTHYPFLVILLSLALVAVSLVSSSPASAVENGVIVDPAFTWTVSLRFGDNTQCSGSLVSPTRVVTAAHCFGTGIDNVVIGSSDLDSSEGIARSITDDDWSVNWTNYASVSSWDVAVIDIGDPVPDYYSVLPLSPTSLNVPIGAGVTLYGYGSTGRILGIPTSSSRLMKTPDGTFYVGPTEESSLTRELYRTSGAASADIGVLGGDSGAPWVYWVGGGWVQFASHTGNAVGETNIEVATSFGSQAILSWVRTHALAPDQPGDTILRDPTTAASWLVGSDGFRYWIPDGSTFNCLTAKGYVSIDRSFSVISQTPDRSGHHASCDPTRSTNKIFVETDGDQGVEHSFKFGRASDQMLLGDFNGDGTDDVGLRRGKQYFFSHDLASGAEGNWTGGRGTDAHHVGDFDGDGQDDLLLVRNNSFFVESNWDRGVEHGFNFGRASDTVLVGDFNGDGRDDVGLRRGNQYFFTHDLESNGAENDWQGGRDTDKAYVGDFNGDGRDDILLVRGRNFFVETDWDQGVEHSFTFGRATDDVFVGDFNGDGRDDIGLRRGNKYFFTYDLRSNGAERSWQGGRSTDFALIGDMNGDGQDDILLTR